jgi:hypothetical protein
MVAIRIGIEKICHRLRFWLGVEVSADVLKGVMQSLKVRLLFMVVCLKRPAEQFGWVTHNSTCLPTHATNINIRHVRRTTTIATTAPLRNSSSSLITPPP